jgi:hypothetical protein
MSVLRNGLKNYNSCDGYLGSGLREGWLKINGRRLRMV